MGMIDHWHPVLMSEAVTRDRPAGVRVCGRELAVFRTADGVAALTDVCPHRRMRLSLGTVCDGKLWCKYHGWSFDGCGRGESPGTPKLHATAESFDAREEHGWVWVKPRGVEARLPDLSNPGHTLMCRLFHTVSAPLETTMDNFCEIEHTPTTHDLFGYPLERMHEVKVEFHATDDTVRVVNSGPPKVMPWILRRILGIRKHFHFYDDWTTYFSPCYSVYDHWWADPDPAKNWEGKVRWRNVHCFWPVDGATTAISTWCFAKSRHKVPGGGLKPFRGLMRRLLDYEVRLDVAILEGLAVKDPDIEGMKLSRFDKVLGLNRERIDRVYRGIKPPAVSDAA